MENGYSYCSNKWALDKDIKNELGLLLIISSLCAERGYCFASNKYLADLFQTNETLISRKLKKLEDKSYIQMEYEKQGTQVTNRYIRLSKTITGHYLKSKPTVIENDKENITSINNISINNKEIYKERFKKPTLEEVKEYCEERNNGIDAEMFINFYESKGWMVGKNKMKDWKACVRTWEKSRNTKVVYQEKPLPDWFGKEMQLQGVTEEEKESMEWLNEL